MPRAISTKLSTCEGKEKRILKKTPQPTFTTSFIRLLVLIRVGAEAGVIKKVIQCTPLVNNNY